MQELGVEKAALGIRYLIRYAKEPNPDYFTVIQDCVKEIKLWCLITLFTNNIDDLWENVPDFIYEDLFLMKRIETVEGVLDYGKGFSSNSNLTFREQFKMIRDRLAHQNFYYQNGMIFILDQYNTCFDLLWLEKLVLLTISSEKNDFKKGMSDIALFSIAPRFDNALYDFSTFWNLGFIKFYKITLLNANKDAWASYFNRIGLSAERYTFDLVFHAVKHKIGTYKINLSMSMNEMNQYLEKVFKEVEAYFGNFIHLEFVPVKSDVFPNDLDFEKLSFKEKLQYLINKIKLDNAYSYNSIIVMNLLRLLNDVEHLSCEEAYILRDAWDFFLKVYANILMSDYESFDKDGELKKDLCKQFLIDSHNVHAKNVYKDYIKVLKRSYEEAVKYQAPKDYKSHVMKFLHYYTHLLEDAINGFDDKKMFLNIRNAITHNQIDFRGQDVRLYVTGRNIHLMYYSKKKESWVSKEFRNNQVIWELLMSKDNFLEMLDYLFSLKQIPTYLEQRKKE